MKTALLFPGQGSQYVGMGQALWEASPDVRELFRAGSDILGFDVEEICFRGPKERLNTTLYTQPVLFIVSVAVFRIFQEETTLPAAFVAGHSLGEYSALFASGAVNAADCLALVTRRGELMEREGEANPGGMRAVLGMTIEEIESLLGNYAGGGGVVVVANHNSEKQVVISGDMLGLDSFSTLCEQQGAKVVALNVSVANHSPLVAGAVDDFAAFMAGISFHPPAEPVIFNVTADRETDPEAIRNIMARQIASRVRWDESVKRMLQDGVELFIEAGPKKVLTGLMRKIIPKGMATCVQFDTPADLTKVIAELGD